MTKVKADRAASVGDFLCRYMRARYHFTEGAEYPLPPHKLASLIGQGKAEFDEIYIEPEANPPIALDRKADDFFTAIIEKNYSAMPGWDPQLLSAWRMHVLRDGPIPREPGSVRRANGTTPGR
jgi:hypothetical protein